MYGNSTETSPFVQALLENVERILGVEVIEVRSISEDATQNRNFIIKTDKSSYFLKAYSEGTVSERVFELNILKKLYKDGYTFPVHPISKEPFIVGGKPVMLFDTIEGTTIDPQVAISDDYLKVIASQLAQMHASLATFNAGEKMRFNSLNFDFVDAFELDTSDDTIEQGLLTLQKAFTGVDTNNLISTIIHDDLSPRNVMLSETGELRFIDFDDAHRSYRISDIGTVIKEFIISPNNDIDHDKINRFIHYYETTRNTPPLTDQEKHLLIPMILRRALFMYAYYSMIEKERNLYLQSNDEYCIVSLLTLLN